MVVPCVACPSGKVKALPVEVPICIFLSVVTLICPSGSELFIWWDQLYPLENWKLFTLASRIVPSGQLSATS